MVSKKVNSFVGIMQLPSNFLELFNSCLVCNFSKRLEGAENIGHKLDGIVILSLDKFNEALNIRKKHFTSRYSLIQTFNLCKTANTYKIGPK